MKRRRTSGEGGLTGGTGDVNPQWMIFTVTQSAADTTTTQQQNIPIQRLPQGGRAQVLEVLRVELAFTSFPAIAAVGESEDSMSVFLSTASFGTTSTNMAEPRVFCGAQRVMRGAFTAGGTYGQEYSLIERIDLSDGAGHGLLIATDSIFAQFVSGGTGAANSAKVRLLYRWKDVSLTEYIGIVQSQS